MASPARFRIGRNATTLGRWVRLLGGLLLVLITGLSMISLTDRADARGVLVSCLAIVMVYELAYLVLEKPLLARMNPWLNSLVMVVPALVIALVPVFPTELRYGMILYLGVTCILNAVMGYGSCEVLAIPTLVHKRQYDVYCPTNLIDAAEQAVKAGKPTPPEQQGH
jgi:Family of unknown function (DUF6410)